MAAIDASHHYAPHRIADRLDRLERLAANMDSRYSLFGIRFGWDSILGLVPGIGDVAALGPAGYILLEAHRMGVPGHVKARMALNTAMDWVVGTVPLLGDIGDVWIKSNRRNVALLRDHFATPPATEQRARGRVS